MSGIANRRETQNCCHFLHFRVTKLSTIIGIGGVVVAKRKIVVPFGFVLHFRVSKVPTVIGIGGGIVVVAKRRIVVTFGLVSCLRVSGVSTVTGIGGGASSRNAEQTTLLDSSCVFASQKCQQSQGSGASWSRRIVVTFGLVLRFRLTSVNSHRDQGGGVVAKRRIVVTFGLVLHFRVSDVSTVTGIGGVVVAKRRIVVTFGFALAEGRGERRERRGERG